jgi:small subunit ribosomal protein S13
MAEDKNFRHLVRIMNTDLIGEKKIYIALNKIKGVSFSLANTLCSVAGVDKNKKTGTLSDAEVGKLNDILKEPLKYGIPEWMLNRQKDPETGETKHLCIADLKFQKENDLKRLQKIKSNRGLRHQWGLPTRGQRTKSNFRRSKVKGKVALGVKRKK